MSISPITIRAAALTAATALTSLGAGCATQQTPQTASDSRPPSLVPFPNVKVLGLDGSPVALGEAARGRVTVVDLWASWCEACRDQHASLNRLTGAYGEELFVAGVNVGEPPSKVQHYVQSERFDYAVFLDPNFELADALAESELPALFLLDERGQVIHRATKLDRTTLRLIDEQLRLAQTRRPSPKRSAEVAGTRSAQFGANASEPSEAQQVARTGEHSTKPREEVGEQRSQRLSPAATGSDTVSR